MRLFVEDRSRSLAASRLPIARLLGIGALLIGGLCISSALFIQARAVARRDLRDAVLEKSEKRVELLRTRMLGSMDVLQSMASLFAARPSLTGDEYTRFVAGALIRQPELQGLGWAP